MLFRFGSFWIAVHTFDSTVVASVHKWSVCIHPFVSKAPNEYTYVHDVFCCIIIHCGWTFTRGTTTTYLIVLWMLQATQVVLNISHKECDQKYSLNKTINYSIVVAILKWFYIEWWEKQTAKPTRKINTYERYLFYTWSFCLEAINTAPKLKSIFQIIIHLFGWW